MCVVKKKKGLYSVHSQAIKMLFHMFTCAFLCVPSNTKQASETTANQTAITSAW